MKFIDKHKSPNFDNRKKGTTLNYIILHYTAMKDHNEAISYLCNSKNKASSHFVISKSGDIYYLVDIMNRAWHAGKSYWGGVIDINSESIGIEIDNSGHYYEFENYTSKQIKSIIGLLRYISKIYEIDQCNILGHSDIAPYRKIDPGEKFPWKKLKEKKVSFLPFKLSQSRIDQINKNLDINLGVKNINQRSLYMLEKIGYDVKLAKNSGKKYVMLIKAYQMHYRQRLVSGILDKETYKIIQSHFNEILT